MARPKAPVKTQAAAVSGNLPSALSASAAIYKNHKRVNPATDRAQIAKAWQIEAYRQVNICGEARYAVSLFAALAARAELGISEPQTLSRKAVWVEDGIEVQALAELAPTVRERSKLIRDYMTHYIIAGECYLIARDRVDTDPGYDENRNDPIWEIVAVTELQKVGETWKVRHDNGNFIELKDSDPIIRMWNPDPSDRREAWSPLRSMLSTLEEIEYLTKHIFTQVKSRLMSAGVWFLPNNLTFPPPPPESVEGGAEALAELNEAELFMLSLAESSMSMLESDDVSFPSIVMADEAALSTIDQNKLIKFWSEIDDKAMTLRSSAVRRFALGMDLPPEQILGSSGLAVDGSGGSAGSVNHWGVWANEEQTISDHVEPALDIFVGTLTSAFLRSVVENTDKVVGYDTASLRLRQDRSKESMELFNAGVLKAEIAVRENGFDPKTDMMDEKEFNKWLLTRVAGGSATPEQVQAALVLLGVALPNVAPPSDDQNGRADVNAEPAPQHPGRNAPPSLEDHPYQGPPREDHDHNPAPFSDTAALAEGLVLRALEKAGNRLLNSGKRGKEKDRVTPAYLVHAVMGVAETPTFDFSLVSVVFGGLPAAEQEALECAMDNYCRKLYQNSEPYTRDGLIAALEGLL